MILQEKASDDLIEIQDITMLINPITTHVSGRSQLGQEEQDPVDYAKASLMFQSGEDLPRCWVDADYRDTQVENG
jgi:hypothetical protein